MMRTYVNGPCRKFDAVPSFNHSTKTIHHHHHHHHHHQHHRDHFNFPKINFKKICVFDISFFLITLFGKCSSNKSHQFFVYYLNPLVSKFFFISVSVYHICSILLPKKPHFSSEKAISFIKWMQILSKVEKLTLLDALKGTKTLRL